MKQYLIFLFLLFSGFPAIAQTYIQPPNLIEIPNSTATAAGTTTFTSSAATTQVFTGSTTQNAVLPNATGLQVGRRFYISNESTGLVTVKYNGGTTATTLLSGQQATLRLVSNGSSTGTWDLQVSGAVSSSQLPNPGASTLGGVESAAAVSHQWVNSISTSGVPALSQPAFTDISGTAQIAQGGTAVTSVTTAPTASSFAGWDANSNLSANAFVPGYQSIASAAATTTLTVGSPIQTYITGSTTQTVKLPVTSTLVAGQQYIITNLSSGTATVVSSGSNTLQAMAQNTELVATVISTSGTGTSSWNWTYQAVQNSLSGGGTVSSVTFTGDGTVLSSTPSSAVTSSGTVTAALATQAKNLVLAGPSSGSNATPTFRSLVPLDMVQPVSGSKTSNYSIATTDYFVQASGSGGTFNLTLPDATATGVKGQIYVIKRIDNTPANAITINTTSSQTIDGALTVHMYTQYESWSLISDGSNWQVILHKTDTPRTTFTMVIIGTASNPSKGTVVVDKAYWFRRGDLAVIIYELKQNGAGSAGSGAYEFTLPTGLTANIETTNGGTTDVAAQALGSAVCFDGSNVIYGLVSIFDTTHIVLYQGAAAGSMGSATCPLSGSSARYGFIAIVPIANWEP